MKVEDSNLWVDNSHLPVDAVRTIAIVLVIMLHAAIEPFPLTSMNPQVVLQWWTANIYNSLARPSVPLFVMLSGALLLQPSKADEPLSVYFKKRLRRIGLPVLFWGAAYFAWDFLVIKVPVSLNFIIQGILTGPYYHFWFVYMLIGLYLIAPILRVIVAHADWKILRLFFLLWFIGTAVVPLLRLTRTYNLDPTVFVLTGWIGYFLLGVYLPKMKIRPAILYAVMILGFVWTMIASYFVTGTIGGTLGLFFYDYLTANVILASVALFMLLLTLPSRYSQNPSGRGGKLLHLISKSTLFTYLFHVIVLESLQNGYFGFKISLNTINPALEIPLITAITLIVCVGVFYLVNKVPYVRRLVG